MHSYVFNLLTGGTAALVVSAAARALPEPIADGFAPLPVALPVYASHSGQLRQGDQ